MAHFARLINNVVVNVVVVNNNVLLDENGIEQEQKGIDFLRNIFKEPLSEWKQTSYNAKFRKHFAGIGMIYDPIKDIYFSEKIYPNWIWNEQKAIFEQPVPYPISSKLEGKEDPLKITWDQGNTKWIGFDGVNNYVWNNINLVWELN